MLRGPSPLQDSPALCVPEMADQQPEEFRMLYGVKFKKQPNRDEKSSKRSRWTYTCWGSNCRCPCIHYKFLVKKHVQNKHAQEWEAFAKGLVPEDTECLNEGLLATSACAQAQEDETNVAGEAGAGHINIAHPQLLPSNDDTMLPGPFDDTEMQVFILFLQLECTDQP
jgi:hypothetical protein